MKYFSSREVAKLLGVSPSCLSRAVWDGRIDPPPKGPGGAFIWTEADIHRASWVLRRRAADEIVHKVQGDKDTNGVVVVGRR